MPSKPSTNRTSEQTTAIKTTREFIQQLRNDKRDNSSIYVEVKIQDRTTLFLVDTGSTHTIISHKWATAHGMIEQKEKQYLNYATTANGSRLTCFGELKTEIQLSNQKITTRLIISDIIEDGILGMDIIMNYRMEINFSQMILQINQTRIPLCDRKGHRFGSRCQVKDNMTLPPYSEKIIPVQRQHETIDREGLVEPTCTHQHNSPGLLVSRCLVQEENMCIKVANISDRPIDIASGRVICRFIGASMLNIEQETSIRNIDFKKHTDKKTIPEHLQPLIDDVQIKLEPKRQTQLTDLLTEYQDIFSTGPYDIGKTQIIQHHIQLKEDCPPIKIPPYRVGHHANKEIEQHVKELLEKDIIEPTSSPYSSPVILVGKKDGTSRFVVDYRKLNKNTIVDAYPLPRIDDSLEAMGGAKYFSTFDLLSGFWQVPLAPDAKDKVAFCTKSGLYTWKSMPMGLAGSPSTFERLMEIVMKGLQWQTMLIYLDDIICFSKTQEEHIQRLRQIFYRLRLANLKIKVSKSKIFQKEVKYLGHIISESGVKTNDDKIAAINNIKSPTSVAEVRSVLGLTGYYRRFYPDYAAIVQPMTQLLKKKYKFNWNTKCEEALNTIKTVLTQSSTLAYPDFDKEFILDTDCSGTAMGAVLSQISDQGEERPIAYFSKALKNSEKNYPITKQEMCALVGAVRHFKPYLYGAQFTCRVDHHSLLWLTNLKNPTGILARWLETLSQFQFKIIHRPGKLHANADALSRLSMMERPKICQIFSMDSSEIDRAQREDLQLKPIFRALENNYKHSHDELKTMSRATRFYFGKINSLQIINNTLMEVCSDRQRTIVPTSLHVSIVDSFHSDDHAGYRRTLNRISIYYQWYGMSTDVQKLVSTCISCQQNKTTNINNTKTKHLKTGAVMDQISIDLAGPFPVTTSGNTSILMVIDHYSKWAEAYALPNTTAETCAQFLYQNFFSKFGFPLILHSDRGTSFTSSLFKELRTIGNMKKTFTACYHPTGNSVCERVIGTLTSLIRTKVQDSPQEWDVILDTIMMAYRATPHSSTGLTPNTVMLGRENRLPQVLCPLIDPLPMNEYIRKLNEQLYLTYSKIEQKIITHAENFDPVVHHAYKEGDQVWILNKKSTLNKPGKLEPRYSGPHTITKTLDHDTYIITTNNNKRRIEHYKRLRKYYKNETNDLPNDASFSTDNDNSNSDEETSLNPSSITNGITTHHENTPTNNVTRSGRQTSVPSYLNEYDLTNKH